MKRFCTACGGALAAEHRFCTVCGRPVGEAPAASSAAAAPPEAATPLPSASGLGRRRVVIVAGLVSVGALTAVVLLLGGPDTPPPMRTAAPPAKIVAPPTIASVSAPPAAVVAAPPAPPSPTAVAPPPSAAITAARWQRYTNTRYGVTIDYPADLFVADPPPPDNAGRGFEAKAIKARFSVYSHANALDVSRDELMAEDVLAIGDDKPQQIARDDGYAVIGARDGDMIVRRVLLSEGGAFVHRLEIAYPLTVAKRFEAIMGRMIGSFAVDPSIPEKAADTAERAALPVPPPASPGPVAPPAPIVSSPPAAPPAVPSPPRQRAAVLPPAAVPAVQAVDTIRLGLKAPGTRGSAGVSLQIPATWTRVAVPETFLLEYGAPATGGGRLRLLIEAVRIAGRFSLAHEVEAIKSVIKPGVDNYREQEADVTIAGRPARRLTLLFVAMDDPAMQRQDYVLVRAGDTLFKIMVDGPERAAAAIRAVFERVVATLAVAE